MSESWVPLSQRSPEVQEVITSVYQKHADSQLYSDAIDLYDELDWGLMDEPLLYRGLGEIQRLEKLLTRAEMAHLLPPVGSSQLQGVQEQLDDKPLNVHINAADQTTAPLKWFIANPQNSAVRDKAQESYYLRLLDLYVAHVSQTGETYFPPLTNKLVTYYDFYGE